MTPGYSRVAWAAFETVFRPWMARRLDGIHVRGLEHATRVPDAPVILAANHPSWWDGFLLREVHRRIRPEAPFHVVMSEAELRRFPFFRWLGAVPLSPATMGPRRLLRALSARVEARPDAVIGYFPQGRIWPSHRRPLGVRPGAAWLASRLPRAAVLPVGLHLEPLTRPGPAAFISVGRPLPIRRVRDTAGIEDAIEREVDAILDLVRRHGESSAEAWPGRSGAGVAA